MFEVRKLTENCVVMLQEQTSRAVNSVVLLVDKESSQRPERCPGISVSLFRSSFVSPTEPTFPLVLR